MIINVENLALGEQFGFDLKEDVTVKGIPAAVRAAGDVVFTKEGYVIGGTLHALLDMKCDLCLKAFKTELDIPFDEVFSNADTGDEKEFWQYSEKKLDIGPAVEANIITAMPMRSVCSEDCKGLCPICGHDLNEGDCGCDREYTNPVFDQLMSLFDEEN